MKTRILASLLALALAGCTTVPTDPTPKQQVIANAVEDVLAIGLVPVLARNPEYINETRTIAALIRSFNGETLTPAIVDSFLAKRFFSPQDARVIAGLVNSAWDTYTRRYAQQVGSSLRPDVKLFLAAVANGIERAIAAVPQG